MTLLYIGLFIWCGAHWTKQLAPGLRAQMGRKGKGIIAAIIAAGLVCIIIGYRQADFIPLYTPWPNMGHLNNSLMLIALFLTGIHGTKGVLYSKLRHPMLMGAIIWAIAHLLVNGDLASVVLFSCIGIWSVITIILINRQPWEAPQNGRGLKGDMMNIAGIAVIYALIAFIHAWLGHPVFEGSYY